MNHEPVKSSTIKSIAYDYGMQRMEVKFHKSGTYVYEDFPHQEYEKLMNADSLGTHFNNNIKGKFETIKGGEDQ